MPSKTAPPLGITDVQGLLLHCDVSEIVFWKISAGRRETEGPDQQTTAVSWCGDESQIEVRLDSTLATEDGEYAVDVSVTFVYDQPLEVSTGIQQEFVEKVGIMTVYPYLREAFTEAAAKLRLAIPTLGLIRAGQVHLTDEPSR
jgi:hypothetical protein